MSKALGRLILIALVVHLTGGIAARAQEPRRVAVRAVHYDVTASLVPAGQSLAARARVEFEARTTSRVVEVELHPSLRLRGVAAADGKALEAVQDPDAFLLRVTLPHNLEAGQRTTLTFDYEGRLAGDEDGVAKGTPLALVGAGTSYLLQAGRWFPLTDYPANRYTATFHLEVPEGLSVVGTGQALPPVKATPRSAAPAAAPAPAKAARPGKTPPPPAAPVAVTPLPAAAGPRVVYTFRSERAEASGTFVIGDLRVVPTRVEGLEALVYVPAGATASAGAYGESLAKIVNAFSSEFGALPEPRLGIVQIPDGTLPGYAAPGILLVSQRQWDPKVNHRLLARLAAWQWWGNQVAPASASDVWLSDGLARYAEALYVQDLGGTEGFHRALEDFAVGALMYEDAAPIAQAHRLNPFTSEYRSVVVNKGALVFHMLRRYLGDETFAGLLRDFYARFAGRSATLDDFTRLAQEKANARAGASKALSLTPFFAQWLQSTGVPEFQLDYVVYRTQKGFRVVGKVKQDLDTFRLPVELKIETEGNPELKTIEVIGANSEFTVETFGRPRPNGLTLDPHSNLLKSSARLRVRAIIARGEELAEAGRFYDAIQQYERAIEAQKNHSLAHFRMGEAMFYQKNLQAAANALREVQVGDLDPSYRWTLVWSHIYLGKIFDLTGQRERAVNEYQKALETNDDTGGALAEAQKYLNQPYVEQTRMASP